MPVDVPRSPVMSGGKCHVLAAYGGRLRTRGRRPGHCRRRPEAGAGGGGGQPHPGDHAAPRIPDQRNPGGGAVRRPRGRRVRNGRPRDPNEVRPRGPAPGRVRGRASGPPAGRVRRRDQLLFRPGRPGPAPPVAGRAGGGDPRAVQPAGGAGRRPAAEWEGRGRSPRPGLPHRRGQVARQAVSWTNVRADLGSRVMRRGVLVLLAVVSGVGLVLGSSPEPAAQQAVDDLLAGRFRWVATGPQVGPAARPDDPCHGVKDPSVVRHDGRWHVFCTIRSRTRTHQIEYLSFPDWPAADRADRHVLKLTDGYFCAPQVFFFTPHRKWYLIHQVSDPSRKPALQPAFSTTADLADPASWTKPELLFREHPDNVKAWIDFWVICDAAKAHLFFTSNDGRMWRSETKLADFPHGWDRPRIVLEGDVFEASHTYRLKGLEKYLTLIEAQAEGG